MTGEFPAKETPTCGLSSDCGQVSCVQQNVPASALASTTSTCKPAFCRYAAAGRPPDRPAPTTITSYSTRPDSANNRRGCHTTRAQDPPARLLSRYEHPGP